MRASDLTGASKESLQYWAVRYQEDIDYCERRILEVEKWKAEKKIARYKLSLVKKQLKSNKYNNF